MKACARHILLKDRAEADNVMKLLKLGKDFGKLAKQYSQCPSGKKGGDLGEFKKGQMVAQFDRAVFKGPLLEIQGPIKTKFGWHIIQTIYRD